MDIAVIKTGGKQYLVKKGDKVKLEKLDGDEGKTINFENVLFTADAKGSKINVGTPKVAGIKVEGKILTQGRARKVKVVKYKPKTRYKKTQGHRQYFTEVEIIKV